jgi:endonuclease I
MRKILIFFVLFFLTSCSPITKFDIPNPSESDIIPAFRFLDTSESNSGQIVLVYSRRTVNQDTYNVTYNIEHVFAREFIKDQTNKVLYDLYNLRPSRIDDNLNRGSFKFIDKPEGTSYGRYDDGWYPGDKDKGDVARALMYMSMTYDLDLTDMIDPKIALKWHKEDPVDAFEQKRADIIKGIQGNTNYFIEDKSLAQEIYGRNTNILVWIIGISVVIYIGIRKYNKTKN